MTALILAARNSRAARWAQDRVLLALALFFAGLLAIDPAQALASGAFVVDALLGIAPFLALSVGLAAWLKAAGADRLMARLIGRAPLLMVLVAATAGALSPFCSCGVIPVVAGLLAAGVPLAPVMAFWISSPLMSPEQFVLIAATIGTGFAVAKTVAAFAIGLAGGLATLGLVRLGFFANPLNAGAAGSCGPACGGGPGEPEVRWAFWRAPARRQAFGREACDISVFLGKWLALAFAIESLMVVYLPPSLIAGHLSADSVFAIPIAVAVGVPAYLNGYAAIPVVAELLAMGMAPGAGLAFMLAGGVTSIPAAMAVLAIARKPVFGLYITIAILGSLAFGYAYQAVPIV